MISVDFGLGSASWDGAFFARPRDTYSSIPGMSRSFETTAFDPPVLPLQSQNCGRTSSAAQLLQLIAAMPSASEASPCNAGACFPL